MDLSYKNILNFLSRRRKQFNLSFLCYGKHIFKQFYSSDSLTDSIDMSFNKFDEYTSKPNESAAPLVIMHGLFGSKTNWQSLSKSFNKSTERTVYAVDARNHGNSPHSDEFSYDLLANDVKHFLTTHSLNKICFLGHSMGGRAAMYFSLKYPELLEKLIIADISPFSSSRDMARMLNFFNVMRSVVVDDSVSSAEGRKQAREQMLKHIRSKLIVDFLLTNFVKTESGSFKWRLNLDSLEKNFKDGIMEFPKISGKFENPTLFIAGNKSDYFSSKDESKILETFTNSKFIYLNAGHWLHYEDPVGFASNVSNFIKS